jgi:hypothetical protein
MSPPHTFALFPKLPKELQIKLWTCALPGPRIIQLYYLNSAFFFRGARPPPVLHTCRTSREVALTVFEHAFARNNKPICIDFAHDTIHLVLALGCANTGLAYTLILRRRSSLWRLKFPRKKISRSQLSILAFHISAILGKLSLSLEEK